MGVWGSWGRSHPSDLFGTSSSVLPLHNCRREETVAARPRIVGIAMGRGFATSLCVGGTPRGISITVLGTGTVFEILKHRPGARDGD